MVRSSTKLNSSPLPNAISTLSRHFLTLICVYALTLLGQVSYWNCFGFDRSADSGEAYLRALIELAKQASGAG
jgi:hypothetical protein